MEPRRTLSVDEIRLSPDLEITEEPERLLSFFIHGIERMRCRFTPGRAAGG